MDSQDLNFMTQYQNGQVSGPQMSMMGQGTGFGQGIFQEVDFKTTSRLSAIRLRNAES